MRWYQNCIAYSRKINWSLLFFLVLMLNVKMVVKLVALIVLLIIHRDLFKQKQIYRQRFIWFYAMMIVIAGFNFLLTIPGFSMSYTMAVGAAIFLWLMCIAAAFLNYWYVERTGKEELESTLSLFFVLNAIVSIIQLLYIMWDAGAINPYTYQGQHQKYFVNTGDRIMGIGFDLSATNSFINAFGVIYFLYKQYFWKSLLCMFILLLTVSNYTNIMLVGVLVLIFIFRSNRLQKSMILVNLVVMMIFMAKVSPQNTSYIADSFYKMAGRKEITNWPQTIDTPYYEKADSLLSPNDRKKKFAYFYVDSIGKVQLDRLGAKESGKVFSQKLAIPKPNIHSAPYWRKRDTTALQREMLVFIKEKLVARTDSSRASVKLRRRPGKLIAFEQIADYFKEHPGKLLTGTGAGNFSSKLAFRTTGMRIMGGYPKKFVRISDLFMDNHLRLYLEYYSKDIELHSLMHNPNSVYAQLTAEYGLIGLAAFVIFYAWYFLKRTGSKGYGWAMLLLLLGAFGTDYWLEHLSIVILFELLMLTIIKNEHAGN